MNVFSERIVVSRSVVCCHNVRSWVVSVVFLSSFIDDCCWLQYISASVLLKIKIHRLTTRVERCQLSFANEWQLYCILLQSPEVKKNMESKISQTCSVVNADWWINLLIILHFPNDSQLRHSVEYLSHLPMPVLHFTGLRFCLVALQASRVDNLRCPFWAPK